MGDSLCIGGDAVVFYSREVYEAALQAGQDRFDLFKGGRWGAVLDEDERLVEGVD